MEKQKTITFLTVLLLTIWGIIAVCLFFNLFIEYSFFVKVVLSVLSFFFFILFYIYALRLWKACIRESKELKRLIRKLETTLIQTEKIQAQNKVKEKLLGRYLDDIGNKS